MNLNPGVLSVDILWEDQVSIPIRDLMNLNRKIICCSTACDFLFQSLLGI